MMNLLRRSIDEQRHLEALARDGFATAALPIMFGGIVLAVFAFVALALGITLFVSHWV